MATIDLQQKTAPSLDDPAFLETLRGQMLSFARGKLADAQLAEDAVQEALAGALKNKKSFQGQSALKTWVFAILKNKITDTLRKRQRQVSVSEVFGDLEESDVLDTLFDQHGMWHKQEQPMAWAKPESLVDDDEFWHVFQNCLASLPEKHARLFMMREYLELDSQEICESEGISVSNLHVILHRARLKLRKHLESQWYAEEKAYA
ncbi:MAG: sigma-70 family RNA polymerase sigma factor [Pontibacterium sp.]